MTNIDKITSAVYNDLVSGLSGIVANPTISLLQLEDEVVETRAAIIRDLSNKNNLPKKELTYSLNCIPLDCMSLDKCCANDGYSQPELHFQIPAILADVDSIQFIGSVDKQVKFRVYTNPSLFKYRKYRSYKKIKPSVFLDTTINGNGMMDGWVFDSPLLEQLTVQAIFYDPRQVDKYLNEISCCETIPDLEAAPSSITAEIKRRLTEAKFKFYRQAYQVPQPNNQVPK